jgi:IS30 family transposase
MHYILDDMTGMRKTQYILQKFGGINPGIAKRPPTSLTLYEREEISRGISANLSFRAIAQQLNRSPSTISREINRNGGLTQYRAIHAEKRAWREAKRPKVCLLKSNETLRNLVEEKLEQKWSPEQIAGWLKRTYSKAPDKHVLHETIYRTLFIQARGALKKTLLAHLRTRRVMRQSKQFNTKGNCRGGIRFWMLFYTRKHCLTLKHA